MKTLTKILVILLLTSFVSCQYDPFAHKYTTKEPRKYELVGTYIFDRQTVDYEITEFQNSTNTSIVTPRISIMQDGTFEVINLPIFESASYEGLISTMGNWKISRVGSVGDGSGNLKPQWGIYMSELPEELRNVGLMNSESPYEIIFGFGDPDAGQAMIFKKE